MKPHATLARTARRIVLDTIAFKVCNRAIVALDRHIDDQHQLRPLERFHPTRQVPQIGRHTIDLFQIDTPWAELIWRNKRLDFMLACHTTFLLCLRAHAN